MRAMENMGEVLLVRAIMGSTMGSTGIVPTSYEVCVRERKGKGEGERGREGGGGGGG